MNDSATRFDRYAESAKAAHDHLASKINNPHGYPDVPSWGYAFSVLLSAAHGNGELTQLGRNALHQLKKQAYENPNYSWEFVVYAIQQTKRLLKDDIDLPCDYHRSKGTRMLNWFLLRQLNRGWFNKRPEWTLLKLRLARHLYTDANGLVLDEIRTRSLQYHAFCLFVICELIEQHPDADFLRDWLQRGATFAMKQMLADGTSLWLGRGQEQIFGYGALIYALEYVNRHIHTLPPESLQRLQMHVLSFQRADGSFPLILRRREAEAPETTFQAHPSGWYGYNTLYDYQPFLAYTLWRTAQLGGARS